MRCDHAAVFRPLVAVVVGVCGLSAGADGPCTGPILDQDILGTRYGMNPSSGVAWDPDGRGPLLERAILYERTGIAMGHADAWRPLPFSQSEATPEVRLGTWDRDGAGPLPPRPVYATYYGVSEWNGTSWNHGASLPSHLHGVELTKNLLSWDPDGDGPLPGRLVVDGGVPYEVFVRLETGAWQSLGRPSSPNVTPTLVAHDADGDGPLPQRLFAGGDFTGAPAHQRGVLVWTGSAWAPAGEGIPGPVHDLVVWDRDGDGPEKAVLVAAGGFEDPVRGMYRLAAWDGASWSPLGNVGPGPAITTLSTVGIPGTGRRGLLVGGDFVSVGGVAASRIAMYDGEAWHAIADGLESAPGFVLGANPLGPLADSFEVYTDKGSWDGEGWRKPGDVPGPSATVTGPSMLLSNWDADGPGPAEPLLILSQVRPGAGSATDFFAWEARDGWRRIEALSFVSGRIHAMTPFDFDEGGPMPPRFMFAGTFDETDDEGNPLRTVGVWDGETRRALGGPLLKGASPGSVTAIGAWDPDGAGPLPRRLFVAGDFTANALGEPTHRIAQWDGTEWRPVGAGLDGIAEFMATWDPDGSGPQAPMLLVSGPITTRDGQGIQRAALWDGAAWRAFPGPLPPGDDSCIRTMWDPDGTGPMPTAPVSGYEIVTTVGPDPSGYDRYTQTAAVRRWNGVEWPALRTYESDWVDGGKAGMDDAAWRFEKLVVWNPDGPGPLPTSLMAVGTFKEDNLHVRPVNEDGLSVGRVHGVSVGEFLSFYDIRLDDGATFDPDGGGELPPLLVAAGRFYALQADGSPAYSASAVARFMHGPPRFVDQPYGLEPNDATRTVGMRVLALGPGVYAYRWSKDGVPLQPGVTPWGSVVHDTDQPILVISNASGFDDGEYVCTLASACGETVSEPYVLEVTFPPPCVADYNGDSSPDILDFLDFMQDFSDCEGEPAPCGAYGNANVNGDAVVDILDFLEFLDAIGDGC